MSMDATPVVVFLSFSLAVGFAYFHGSHVDTPYH